jgi:hypothetical protein
MRWLALACLLCVALIVFVAVMAYLGVRAGA